MNELVKWILMTGLIVVLPPLSLGLIRKVKARLQSRVGPPLWQPLLDLNKLVLKGELVSSQASWVVHGAAAANACILVLIALSSPWLPDMPSLFHADIFVLIYLFALVRFLAVLSALDAGSPFGGFAASREVTLAVLVEPAVMLCFIALAVVAHTPDLWTIFSFSADNPCHYRELWGMAGCGLYLSSVVELSRMPADDPTTHLELTMVHEAMILENSGPNLAVTEYAASLKLLILMGMSAQCFLHAVCPLHAQSDCVQIVRELLALAAVVTVTALIESTAVKLRWTKLPEFVAYAVTFGLLCCAFVLGVPH